TPPCTWPRRSQWPSAACLCLCALGLQLRLGDAPRLQPNLLNMQGSVPVDENVAPVERPGSALLAKAGRAQLMGVHANGAQLIAHANKENAGVSVSAAHGPPGGAPLAN